ncbi:MAG: hypothetical protein AAFW74_04800 [Pseudomonadota bacterium]
MENLADIITTGNGYLDAGIAAFSAATAWLGAKFDWWKDQSKPVRAAVAIGVFLSVAFVLSLITAPFT